VGVYAHRSPVPRPRVKRRHCLRLLNRLVYRRGLHSINFFILLCPDICPSVHLSVCPSVAYIANNSRTQMLSVPNLQGRFLTLDTTRFKVKRSTVRVRGRAGAYRVGRPAAILLVINVINMTAGTRTRRMHWARWHVVSKGQFAV